MNCTPRVKTLKITAISLWGLSMIAALARLETLLGIVSPLVALSSCLLILCSRETQGHYQRISSAYAVGIGIWFAADCLAVVGRLFLPESAALESMIGILRLFPDCFFALGLIFFMHSEYNLPHFQRVVLHTFAVAFPTFLVFQKLFLVRWTGLEDLGQGMSGTVLYFFVAVFTVIMVLSIFVQTNFKGHTMGTNVSAVALVFYNCCELRRILLQANGAEQNSLVLSSLYLLTIVIYAQAQSDPQLISRKQEPDSPGDRKQLKSSTAWICAVAALTGAIILYVIDFFDERDLYTMLIAIMAYLFAFRSIQANELNTRLLEREIGENTRLEHLVAEKTRELREMNDHLEQISSTDVLTGLHNRRYGLQKFQSLATDPDRRSFAALLLDLNYFKHINDSYGHDAGDEVLKQVAQRLMRFSNEHVTVIRMGGDEFLVLQTPAEDRGEIESLAERICRALDEPVFAAGRSLPVSACIGIAVYPTDAGELEELYRCADQAMYSIKHKSEHSGFRFCE